MREISLSAEKTIKILLNLPKKKNLCILDSCGVGHLKSHLLIAGFSPIELLEINSDDSQKTLQILDEKISQTELAAIFSISYDFGLKLENIKPRPKSFSNFAEPDVFIALFDTLIVHDYDTQKTFLVGNEEKFDDVEKTLFETNEFPETFDSGQLETSSNFTKSEYENAVEEIKEFIRNGDTYQTNLTRQIRLQLPDNLVSEQIFLKLRRENPAPFASFLHRRNDVVISASPERFFKVENRKISVSPIKGTRPRGENQTEDLSLQNELLTSEKDRAENVMIVDLLRNDIGRICEFGSVAVEKLCDIEEHPTLFHLVSTVSGNLRDDINFSDILHAVFPCGSITGAPKISTMKIIDKIETAPRGLSMGAIGYAMHKEKGEIRYDLSVAIRTMVIRNREAIFNVGGGIVIDSEAESEFEETVVKSKALLQSVGSK